ncbi:Uncharacterized protein Adt_24678 [Abeliophyllum distichum]|uniref:Uncharacterized protein n=1 Tax=Abeliophyllum distichum TaxID=126358 RepID=A0ABD1SEG2_9LAMI
MLVMKIGKVGGYGNTGAVVLLGVATLDAAAIESTIIVRRKGQKSGKNHHRHQEVDQSLPTELPETLNKENDRDNASKPNTLLSKQINKCWNANAACKQKYAAEGGENIDKEIEDIEEQLHVQECEVADEVDDEISQQAV